ncbi:MAG: hypothetical protein QM755_04100 [Luteolibacter sp.]
MKMKTTLFALAALCGAGSVAMAQDAPAGGGDKPARPERGGQRPGANPEMIKKYDKDGDGKLSEEERKAMMEDMKAKREAHEKALLEKYDADKDGKLSDEERKTAREEEQKRILATYDKDKDGKLSEEERKAAIEAGEMLGFGGGRQGGPGGEGGRGGRGPGGQGGRPDGPPPAPPEGK